MVQCPQCKTAIGVRDNAGGSRVGCPHCGQSFIVPGFSGGTGYPTAGGPAPGGTPPDKAGAAGKLGDSDLDDDDWLNITDEPIVPKTAPPASSPPAATTPPSTADAANDDWGDFDASALQPAKPRPSASSFSSTDFSSPEDLFAAAPLPGGTANPDDDLAATFDERPDGINSDGQKIEYQNNYRVRCPHCGTQNDVTASQAEKKIRCRDCFTVVRVPKPPRVPRKVTIDMEAAPAFQFSPNSVTGADRPDDPFRKSASELLAAAAKTEKDEPKPDLDVPRIRDWAAAVFGIFTQIGVMAHWLILSTLASVVAFFALAIDSPMLVVGLFAAGGFFAAIVLACGFAIMQAVANEQETVEEWPVTLEPMEWITASIFCFAAAGLAYGPGWFIGYVTFGNSLTTVCLSMISVFLIFPFVLLSMLDMQNIFVPFSPDVGRSVTRCEEAWGGFYFSSGIVFFFTFMVFLFASLMPPPTTAVIGIFTAVATTFLYFAMLGRLAFAIGQGVNAEAKVNTIEEERERERKQKQ